MKMIDGKQVQLIHVAKAKLGLSDDDYRLIIRTQTKKESCKELTYVQASHLIDYFKTLGFSIKRRYRTPDRGAHRRNRRRHLPGNVVFLPSFYQIEMVEALAAKIAWRVEGGYLLWLKKYMKIARIRTAEEAEKVIEGLKGMLAHQIEGAKPCRNG